VRSSTRSGSVLYVIFTRRQAVFRRLEHACRYALIDPAAHPQSDPTVN
jgi:hypothetical protein